MPKKALFGVLGLFAAAAAFSRIVSQGGGRLAPGQGNLALGQPAIIGGTPATNDYLNTGQTSPAVNVDIAGSNGLIDVRGETPEMTAGRGELALQDGTGLNVSVDPSLQAQPTFDSNGRQDVLGTQRPGTSEALLPIRTSEAGQDARDPREERGTADLAVNKRDTAITTQVKKTVTGEDGKIDGSQLGTLTDGSLKGSKETGEILGVDADEPAQKAGAAKLAQDAQMFDVMKDPVSVAQWAEGLAVGVKEGVPGAGWEWTGRPNGRPLSRHDEAVGFAAALAEGMLLRPDPALPGQSRSALLDTASGQGNAAAKRMLDALGTYAKALPDALGPGIKELVSRGRALLSAPRGASGQAATLAGTLVRAGGRIDVAFADQKPASAAGVDAVVLPGITLVEVGRTDFNDPANPVAGAASDAAQIAEAATTITWWGLGGDGMAQAVQWVADETFLNITMQRFGVRNRGVRGIVPQTGPISLPGPVVASYDAALAP